MRKSEQKRERTKNIVCITYKQNGRQLVGTGSALSLSISLASVLAGVQTSQRRLRICICILQTIEKVVKVFHAALLCFHFITHTHRDSHICTHTHTWRHIRRALLHDAFLCSSCICNGSELEEPLAATSVCHITVDPPHPTSSLPWAYIIWSFSQFQHYILHTFAICRLRLLSFL